MDAKGVAGSGLAAGFGWQARDGRLLWLHAAGGTRWWLTASSRSCAIDKVPAQSADDWSGYRSRRQFQSYGFGSNRSRPGRQSRLSGHANTIGPACRKWGMRG
jgi:hypothetical protein